MRGSGADQGIGIVVAAHGAIETHEVGRLNRSGESHEVTVDEGDSVGQPQPLRLLACGLEVRPRRVDLRRHRGTTGQEQVVEGTDAAADVEDGQARRVIPGEGIGQGPCPGPRARATVVADLAPRDPIVELDVVAARAGRSGHDPQRSGSGNPCRPARATVFLRWPTRWALITDAVRRAMGRPVLEGDGSVESDLRRGTAQIQEVFGSAAFQRIFPAVVAGLLDPDNEHDRLSFDELAPGRAVIADGYRRLAEAQGFRPEVTGDLVVDLLIGSHIGYFLATGAAPSAEIRDRLPDVVVNGLRERRQGIRPGS